MAFLVPLSYLTAFDNTGAIIPGARGYVYEAGTTNTLQTYSNYNLSLANTIPYITANSAGRFGAAYVADGAFLRFLIKSADGAITYLDCDNILAPISGNVNSLFQTYVTQNSAFAVDASMNGQLIGVDTSLGDVAVTADPVALLSGFWFTLKKITNDGGKITLTPSTGTIDGAGSYEIDTYQESTSFVSQTGTGFAIQAATSREEYGEIDIVEYTAASVTLQLSDKGKFLRMNRATAQALIIPLNSTVPLPIGTRIEGMQYNTGEVTLTPVSGALTLTSEGAAFRTIAQRSVFVLTKLAANEWLAAGGLEV